MARDSPRSAPADDGTGRRTFLKTVGTASTAAMFATPASAADLERTIGDGLDPVSGRTQEAMVVFRYLEDVDRMDELDLPGGYYAYETLPFAYAELYGDQIRTVAAWEETMRVVDNREAELDNHESKEDTRARKVWEDEDLGYTGEHVHVAIIDSGLDAAHPGHMASVDSNYQWVGDPTTGDVVWQDVSPGNNDALGHGTHVAGSITGGGDGSVDEADYAGMAPDATLTAYGAPMLGLTRATRAAAYDHIIAGKRDGDNDIRLISNSWTWGSEYDPWHPIPVAVWTAFQEGILTLFSAGNSGPETETLNETKDPFILSVAATDGEMAIADFSSRGIPGGQHDRETVFQNVVTMYEEGLEPEEVGPIELERPSVAAKGETVMSTQSPDAAYYSLGALDTPISVPPDPADPPVSERGAGEPLYGTLSGTSMSSPTTAGVVALFLDAYYDEYGEYPSPIDTINTMEATAREDAHESYLRTNVGAGYVDAKASVEAVLDAGGLPPGLDDREELPPGLEEGDLPPGLANRDGDLPGFDDVELADPHPDASIETDGPPREPDEDDPHETVDETTVSGELLVGAGTPAGVDEDSHTYTTDFAECDHEWRLFDARIEVTGPPGFEWTDLEIEHRRDGEWVPIGERRFEAAEGTLRIVEGWLDRNPGADDVAVVADGEDYRITARAATDLDAVVTYDVTVSFVAFDLEG